MEDKVYLKVDGMIIKAGTDTDLVNYANSEGLEGFEIVDELKNGDEVFITEGLIAVYTETGGMEGFAFPSKEFREFVQSIEKDEEGKQRLMDLGLPLNDL